MIEVDAQAMKNVQLSSLCIISILASWGIMGIVNAMQMAFSSPSQCLDQCRQCAQRGV